MFRFLYYQFSFFIVTFQISSGQSSIVMSLASYGHLKILDGVMFQNILAYNISLLPEELLATFGSIGCVLL